MTLWLRISSIVALLFATGHTLGGLKHWSPVQDNPVFQSMRTVLFDVEGMKRSYFDFYMGFGYTLTVTQLMQAALLWQLAGLAKSDAPRARPMVGVITLAALATAAITWIFILPVPFAFALVLLICLAIAYFQPR